MPSMAIETLLTRDVLLLVALDVGRFRFAAACVYDRAKELSRNVDAGFAEVSHRATRRQE